MEKCHFTKLTKVFPQSFFECRAADYSNLIYCIFSFVLVIDFAPSMCVKSYLMLIITFLPIEIAEEKYSD